jgi:hypothetical protein
LDDKEFYISIVLSGGRYYIATSKTGVISAFPTAKDGTKFYEDSYNTSHERGYEASMSACINHMTYSPSIVKVSGLDEIKKMVGPEPHLFGLSHISGSMTVISIPDLSVGQEYWDKGEKPKLIHVR